MNAPPHNLEAEQAVLGAVLLSSRNVIPRLVVDEGLRPEHFYRARHQAVFEAMLTVHDRGESIDVLTLSEQLASDGRLDEVGGAAWVDALAAPVPAAGNVRQYARIVNGAHRWRIRMAAANEILLATATRDETAYERAEAALATPQEVASTYTRASLKKLVESALIVGHGDNFPTPFVDLTKLLKLRRGHVALLGGWTSDGKSALLDDMLERCHATGLNVHLYLNEMTPEERVFRLLARRTGIPSEVLEGGNLGPRESEAVGRELDQLPFGITDAAGWSAAEIARHMAWHKFDVVGLDILHLVEYKDEADLRQISGTLNRATKRQAGNCALVATVHLNDARAIGPKLPRPHLRDIKGASALRQDADKVMFVYRERDDDGNPTSDATVYVTKNRQGRLDGVKAHFNADRVRFEAA